MPKPFDPKQKCFLIHIWVVIKDTGKVVYRECAACGLRRSHFYSRAGFEAINHEWLEHRTDEL